MIPEWKIQRGIVRFLEWQSKRKNWFYFHVPNGGHMSGRLGNRVKQMGAKRGVPDILILTPEGRVIQLEVKSQKGRLSEDQKQWRERSEKLEIPYYLVRSIDDVRAVLAKEGLI